MCLQIFWYQCVMMLFSYKHTKDVTLIKNDLSIQLNKGELHGHDSQFLTNFIGKEENRTVKRHTVCGPSIWKHRHQLKVG